MLPHSPLKAPDAADCAVYFLDVGQGDSILIQIGTDYNMLIDAGTREAGETIESDLQALGVTSLDAVVATHPHADHIGSMKQIIEDYTIGTFYMPLLPDDQTPTTATYENMLDALLDKNVQTEQISTDTKISAPENANFAVLSPKRTRYSITSTTIPLFCASPTAISPLCSPAMPKPRLKRIS